MFQKEISKHILTMQSLLSVRETVAHAVKILTNTIDEGRKILVCGNGGSAADSQHFAAEIVGRFQKERRGWPAVALTTDTSILTAVANDYGYDDVFARQAAAVGMSGDVLIGISTSGSSLNIEKAVNVAKKMGMITIGLLGRDGGRLADQTDLPIIVPSQDTARIQEAHIFILHYLASRLEAALVGEK